MRPDHGGLARHMPEPGFVADPNLHQLQEEYGLIKVNFVRTKDNVLDLGMKNVTTDVYEMHEGKLIVLKESVT